MMAAFWRSCMASKHVLIGNTFPLTLVRGHRVTVEEIAPERFRAEMVGAEVCSFWGHTNSRAEAAAEHPACAGVDRAAFLAQVRAFLQTSWAVLPEPSGQMGKDYEAIGKRLAARRNVRAFDAWHEHGENRQKDVLSGKEAALRDGLGAMNLIKRTLSGGDWELPKKEKYLAVLMMDGDRMGETLSRFQTQADLKTLCAKIGESGNLLQVGADATTGLGWCDATLQ